MYKDLYSNDPKPKYCSVCRKPLVSTELTDGFDPYSGDSRIKKFIACPWATKNLDRSYHDVWEVRNEEAPYFTQQYIVGGY